MYFFYLQLLIIPFADDRARGGGGHLAGILPQIWPHSAGFGAPLVYQKSCKTETTPGEAFSRALKS